MLEDKEVELCNVPYGIEFECDGRRYIPNGFANTRTLCYDITDIKQVQISSYTKVKVCCIVFQDIQRIIKDNKRWSRRLRSFLHLSCFKMQLFLSRKLKLIRLFCPICPKCKSHKIIDASEPKGTYQCLECNNVWSDKK